MSFELRLDAKSRAATRLIVAVQRSLLNAALVEREKNGLTKLRIAEKLGIDKSRVTRLLNGAANLTLRSLAELAWALGYEAKIVFEKVGAVHNSSVPVATPVASTPIATVPLGGAQPVSAAQVQRLFDVNLSVQLESSRIEAANSNTVSFEVAA